MWEKTPWVESELLKNYLLFGNIVCKKNVCVTFCCFSNGKEVKKIQATLQMTLFEFKILFDPTLGLQGGDKVQDESDVER